MRNRFKKCFVALLMVLLITLGCLAFMPWQMSEVIPQLDDTQKCMILRYENGKYSTVYPKNGELERVVVAVGEATGHFDRKRQDIAPSEYAPLYRIYFWDSTGRMPEIWICGTEFFYENNQFVLNGESAEHLNSALQMLFGKG